MRPEWNFDALGYAAAARAQLGQGIAEIHEGTFSDLRAIVPRRHYRELVESSAYRQSLAREPARLAVQIPFYASKTMYVTAVSALHAAGVNSVRAAFLVTAVSYGALGGVLIFWMSTVAAPRIGWIVGLCLMLSAPLRETGGLATPDALATLFSMLTLFWMKRRIMLGVIAAVAAVATRPDGCLLALAILGWRAWLTPESRQLLGLGAGACIATSVLLPLATDAYPWSVLFTHTFVARVVDLADVTAASVPPGSYLKAVGRGLLGEYVLHPSIGLVFAALTTIVWAQLRDYPKTLCREIRLLLVLVWVAAVAHFIAFPMLADRFFIAHYLFVSMCALTLVGRIRDDASPAFSPRVPPQKPAQSHDQQDP